MFYVAPDYLEVPATSKNCCVLKRQILGEKNLPLQLYIKTFVKNTIKVLKQIKS